MNSPNEAAVDSTQSSPGGRTGWDEVTVSLSHRSHSRLVNDFSRHAQVPLDTKRTSCVSNRFNVCPDSITSVDSTTSATRVPILTSKSWNEIWANGFDDQTEKRIPANCCVTTTFYLSRQQVFWRPRFHYRSADDSIMRQSHDCNTGDQPASATVPVHWTWTRMQLYTQKVYRKTLRLLMKHETTDQLSHTHSIFTSQCRLSPSIHFHSSFNIV